MKIIVFLLCGSLLFMQCGRDVSQKSLKDWSSTYQVETGVPVSVALTAYSTTMLADGKDQTVIRATVIDSTGREIRNADLPIRIYISGDASAEALPEGEPLKTIVSGDSVSFRESVIVNGECAFAFIAGTKPDRIK
ncbi:MAG: hypothetical protein IH593_13265, partial [Bacteroidales bacterium]|nr:hypothetical protein [Bacteroidales bacterium]